MKQSDIKNLSITELEEKLSELKIAYQQIKMSHAVTPIQNPLQIREVRRTIARISTELSKRELQTI